MTDPKMTVTELRKTLEKIEAIGKGDLPIVVESNKFLLVALTCGTTQAWPESTGRYRGAGQMPNKAVTPCEVVIIGCG